MHESMISSHVERSLLLWLHNKSCPFVAKKNYSREMVWHFIGDYINYKIIEHFMAANKK